MPKALLIRSYTEKRDQVGTWHDLRKSIRDYVLGIQTGDPSGDIPADIVNALVTGVPSPWARAKLFHFAFTALRQRDSQIPARGLMEFYKGLLAEWKGLMAVLALFPDRLDISDPVILDPDRDQDLFDISSAFGRMLFDDRDHWSNPETYQSARLLRPYLHLIYYGRGKEKRLVGATSPYSLVITGVDYTGLKNTEDIGWYRNGRFEDPLPFLSKDQRQRVYLFVRNVNSKILDFQASINVAREGKQPLELDGLKNVLQTWEQEIAKAGEPLLDVGPVPQYEDRLTPPFRSLFSSRQEVYLTKEGALTFNRPPGEHETIADLQGFLMKEETIAAWVQSPDPRQPLEQSPVHYLRVEHGGTSLFFPLPLSQEGLLRLRHRIGSMVSHSGASRESLVGSINASGRLVATLTVLVDGKPIQLNPREYSFVPEPQNKVILWPNFISDSWNAYYLYSEYPGNVAGMTFVPFFKKCRVTEPKGPSGTGILATPRTGIVFAGMDPENYEEIELDVQQLVRYPANEVPPEYPTYEVTRSSHPVAGLEVRMYVGGVSRPAGFLLLKDPSDETMGDRKILDLSSNSILDKAVVGIDFGSTNSSVSFTLATAPAEAHALQFHNRRLCLVGTEVYGPSLAERNELLFFQNEEHENGQVKSWLHEHDSRYVPHAQRSAEVAGGTPIFETNLDIRSMDRNIITTQVGRLFHNMKWLTDQGGTDQKGAYLKTLWLKICAELYAQSIHPDQILWSYPGSFSTADRNSLETIYGTDLGQLTPILGADGRRIRITVPEPITEAHAVCKFTLGGQQTLALTPERVFLGIDVGGSTSDILLVAVDRAAQQSKQRHPRLMKQSSIRLAAGVFFGAVVKSQAFRQAILDFHNAKSVKRLRLLNIGQMETRPEVAPFYLNNILDQLQGDDFKLFYTHLGKRAPFVFAIPSYVTGLLLFYSGKLLAHTLQTSDLSGIQEVHLLPFGKGGRIFDWLEAFPGERRAWDYYSACFKSGFGERADQLSLIRRNDVRAFNKSEVSRGLALTSNLLVAKDVQSSSDIFGERGFTLDGSELDELAAITPAHYQQLKTYGLGIPRTLTNFEQFLELYLSFVGPKGAHLLDSISSLREKKGSVYDYLLNYITNDPEFTKAERQKDTFEYRHPMLISEGMCYLDLVLIPEIFQR